MIRKTAALFLLFSLTLFAENVRVEPLEFWQSASAWPDKLTVDQLITASLAASGQEGDSLLAYSRRFRGLLDDFTASELPLWKDFTDREKGEELLLWLHREIMTGQYHADQTRIDTLLNRGDYNCVSSALVYLIFSRAAGLDTAGEETTDHAFCTLRDPSGGKIDIETTTPMGFDPGTKKEFTQSFTGRTGFTYVAPGNYRQRKPASDKDMITLVLQNRIALSQRRMNYESAVGPAVDRYFFLPTETNRRDMNDAFRNYVSLLNGQERFEEALDFLVPLSREMNLLGNNGDLITILIENQTYTLINRNALERASDFLEIWKGELPSLSYDKLIRQINEKRAEISLNEQSYPEALSLIRDMRDGGGLGTAKSNELITWLHQNQAMGMIKERGADREETYWEILAFFDSLPEDERNLPGIRDHRERYRQNWAVLIHNRFADLVNRGKYEEAGSLLDQALGRDSAQQVLKKDRAYLDRILSPSP